MTIDDLDIQKLLNTAETVPDHDDREYLMQRALVLSVLALRDEIKRTRDEVTRLRGMVTVR